MTATELLVTRSSAKPPRAKRIPRAKTPHKGAIAVFLGPFGILFLLFYLLPIGYAIWQSLLVVQRDGLYGEPTEVFGGLTQYIQVFQNAPFWESVGRVLLFGVVQVPVMLGLALLFALLLDSPALKGKRFFRLAFFAPYAVPGVIAAIMWASCTRPTVAVHRPDPLRRLPLARDDPLVDRERRDVGVRGLQHAHHLLALLAIPAEVYEAARLDGAGQIRIAWSIKIPMVAPAIILTAVFSIIGTLQLLAEPQVFRSFSTAVSSSFTPNMTIYATSAVPNPYLAAAFSVVLALATCVLSFAFLKLTQRKAEQ